LTACNIDLAPRILERDFGTELASAVAEEIEHSRIPCLAIC
jgi:transcriptional regulator GlxA family with amidase domain